MADKRLARMKQQVYVDPRPASYFDRFHERARTREPDWVYGLCRAGIAPYVFGLLRGSSIGAHHVPAAGPAIVAPNHFSVMDHFIVGSFIRRRVRFMAKSQLFSPPLQWVFTHGGVFPVRRGARDDEAFVTAELILARGGLVLMYPEAGRSRTGRVGERAKPGVGRLALESGAPVIPVAISGSQRVRNWKRLQFPRVTVHYGEPMTFPREEAPSRERQQEVADAVFGRVRALHAALERHGPRAVRRAVERDGPPLAAPPPAELRFERERERTG